MIILYFTSGLLDSLLCQYAKFGTSNALGLSARNILSRVLVPGNQKLGVAGEPRGGFTRVI